VLEFAPDDPSTVFAGSRVLHASYDAGQTWVPLHTFANPIKSLTVSDDFSVDGMLAVSFGLAGGGVEVSVDGGSTWTAPATGLSDTNVNSVDLADDGTLFAATQTAGAFYLTSLTVTWVLSDDGLEIDLGMTTDHWRHVVASPDYSTDGLVFVGAFEGLHHTDDRDGAWEVFDIYGTSIVKSIQFSPDYANDGAIYVSDYGGGLARYDLDPALPRPGAPENFAIESLHAGRWSNRSTGLDRLWSSALAVSPDFANDGIVYYSYTRLFVSNDAGLTFNPVPIPYTIQILRTISLSPDFPTDQTMMIGSEVAQGTFRSTDAGANWTAITAGLPTGRHAARLIEFSPNFAVDQTVFMALTMEVVTAAGTGVYRSIDGGITWSILPGFTATDHITALEVSPAYATDGTVFVGTTRNAVWRTTDGGTTWGPTSGFPTTHFVRVNGLAASPDFGSDGTVFATTLADRVYRSTDGGLTWAPSGDGGPDAAPWGIEVSPDFANDGTVIVQTYDWMWASTDRGDNWTRMPVHLRIDEDEPTNVVASGSWTEIDDSACLGLSYYVSSTAGDTLSFEFFGDSVSWYANLTPTSGLVDVSIDGGPPTTIDLYSPTRLVSQPVFQLEFGDSDWRTLEVSVLGIPGPLSTGTDVENDGVGYEHHNAGVASFYGQGLAGTGGWIPTAIPTGTLAPGGGTSIEIRGARGGAIGALVVAAKPVRIPQFGGTLLVDTFLFTDFHVLGGATGVAGAGTASIPLTIPADPSLSGLVLFAQAGQLDPSAVAGVALSRGVRLPIQ
jgi:hypothetical protein